MHGIIEGHKMTSGSGSCCKLIATFLLICLYIGDVFTDIATGTKDYELLSETYIITSNFTPKTVPTVAILSLFFRHRTDTE